MRKLLVLEHITIDGVIQAPGGPQEDTSGNFPYGGWIAPFSDELLSDAIRNQMNQEFDLILGRKTYDIWSPYWPNHGDIWPNVNAATKYIASNTMASSDWLPSIILNGDIAEKIATIKQGKGPDLHIWGSSNLLQTLIKHDLVDEYWLMIYPITLGSGKKLFADGTTPSAFEVTESRTSTKGVMVVNYKRAGEIKKKI